MDAASRLFPVGQLIDVVAMIFLAVILLTNAKGFNTIVGGLGKAIDGGLGAVKGKG